jgi:hypothetical protein
MAAESGADVHHGASRRLPGLFDAAAGGLADWTEFDAEAERLSIEVCWLSRESGSSTAWALPLAGMQKRTGRQRGTRRPRLTRASETPGRRKPLCDFLAVHIPDEPFPRLSDSPEKAPCAKPECYLCFIYLHL